jgi:hypothetical protein
MTVREADHRMTVREADRLMNVRQLAIYQPATV